MLGALDPDRFGQEIVARKGGGKGSGYFAEESGSADESSRKKDAPPAAVSRDGQPPRRRIKNSTGRDTDDDEPAYLYMYEQYAMTAVPISKLKPARRMSPSDDTFYPTVAVQALMRILKDNSLSNLHGMVMKVCGHIWCTELTLIVTSFIQCRLYIGCYVHLQRAGCQVSPLSQNHRATHPEHRQALRTARAQGGASSERF